MATEFHPFPRLPTELRHMIWELTVQQDAGLVYPFGEPWAGSISSGKPLYIRIPEPPAAIFVSREAQLVALNSLGEAEGAKLLEVDGPTTHILVRPWDSNRDYVYVPRERREMMHDFILGMDDLGEEDDELESDRKAMAEAMKKVILPAFTAYYSVQWMSMVLPQLPGLEKVHVLWGPLPDIPMRRPIPGARRMPQLWDDSDSMGDEGSDEGDDNEGRQNENDGDDENTPGLDAIRDTTYSTVAASLPDLSSIFPGDLARVVTERLAQRQREQWDGSQEDVYFPGNDVFINTEAWEVRELSTRKCPPPGVDTDPDEGDEGDESDMVTMHYTDPSTGDLIIDKGSLGMWMAEIDQELAFSAEDPEFQRRWFDQETGELTLEFVAVELVDRNKEQSDGKSAEESELAQRERRLKIDREGKEAGGEGEEVNVAGGTE